MQKYSYVYMSKYNNIIKELRLERLNTYVSRLYKGLRLILFLITIMISYSIYVFLCILLIP